MNENIKLIIPIIMSIMISIVPLDVYACNNNNDLKVVPLNKITSSLIIQPISNNSSNESISNLKLDNTNNDVTSKNTNSSKSIIKVVASFFPIYEFVKNCWWR